MPDVTFTVDGKKLTAPSGTLLIDACRKAGIEIPSFCYYPGLSLQAACRMCVVRQEKVPKLQTACTTMVAEGQVFFTDTPEVQQARKATLELLLGNHPLDCPVCDAGGECELQDMTFRYGAGESLYAEAKNHRDEQQWSPAVFYDRPRCILCYRCTRVCGEGMDVWALGVDGRGSGSAIVPNRMEKDGGGRLDCEQCGMCIDICPVGALTSGSYRYKTRPWEMTHVSTVCTHCADGCKVTLGMRQTSEGAEIIRADSRDRSGINNDFLCAKGRFGFDFVHSPERLMQPLIRNAEGRLEPATWERAIRYAAEKLKAIRDSRGGSAIGVIGSNRSSNEENYLLQKFARTILGTNNIDHERSADYPAFARALAGNAGRIARMRDVASAPAILLIGGNPTEEHPLLAWRVRSAARLSRARLYIANHKPIKLDRHAKAVQVIAADEYSSLVASLASGQSDFAKAIAAEESLLVLIGSELRGSDLENLVSWGLSRGPNPDSVRFALIGDYVNSRGAADMGLLPDLLPGYVPVTAPGPFAEYAGLAAQPGKTLPQMLDSGSGSLADSLAALLVFGADPLSRPEVNPENLKDTFLVVSDLFFTETAARADVVFPAASLYECSGTVTNTFGDVQSLRKAADVAGVKPGFEILVRLAEAVSGEIKALVPFGKSAVTADLGQSRGAEAGEADQHAVWLESHGLEPRLSPFDPFAALDEIARLVPGYSIDRFNLLAGNDEHASPASDFVPLAALAGPELITPAHDTLFTSGTLGRYSHALQELEQHQAREITSKANRT
jgi:NADH-quinone oxidoreductase subunit G